MQNCSQLLTFKRAVKIYDEIKFYISQLHNGFNVHVVNSGVTVRDLRISGVFSWTVSCASRENSEKLLLNFKKKTINLP